MTLDDGRWLGYYYRLNSKYGRHFWRLNGKKQMSLQPWAPYLSIIVIILGVALTVLVLLQTKGSDLGGFFGGGGGDSGGFRTRRGIEVVLHRLTIGLAVFFFIATFLAFMAWGQVA